MILTLKIKMAFSIFAKKGWEATTRLIQIKAQPQKPNYFRVTTRPHLNLHVTIQHDLFPLRARQIEEGFVRRHNRFAVQQW